MKIIPTTLLALLMAGATTAHAKDVNRGEPAPTEQEELAIAALEGLMAQPPERALPIIKKVLAGSQTTLVKQRALFVLSQIDSAEAQQILIQASRSTDPALRSVAPPTRRRRRLPRRSWCASRRSR